VPLAIRVVLGVEAFLALAVMAGLAYRARWRISVSFLAYASTVVILGVVASAWPEAVYTWRAWLVWQTVQLALKLAVLFELGTYIFNPFPGALATMRVVIVLVLMATAAALVTLRSSGKDLWDFALQIGPVANQGAAWGYGLLLALSTWFFVPMDSWRRALLTGMAIYGMAFTVAMATLERLGWGAREILSYANMGAYVLLLGYWNFAAWRAATADDGQVGRLRQELALRLAARTERP